jgi:hypothetical protein
MSRLGLSTRRYRGTFPRLPLFVKYAPCEPAEFLVLALPIQVNQPFSFQGPNHATN